MAGDALKGRNVAVDARFLKRKGIGISRYLAQSVNELIEAGANVSLLLDDGRWRSELSADYPAATIILVPGKSRFLWEQITLKKHLRDAAYDAFIAPANYGLPLGYRGQTKLVLIIHDVIPLKLPRLNLLDSLIWTAFYLVSTVISVAKADQIVTVSDASARDITRLLRRQQVAVVYPQIDLAYSSKQEASDSSESDLGEYFVYNGGTDPRKNVPMLLRAVALAAGRLPTIHLVVLGAGYDHFRELIENLGISSRVHLLGYVSETRKAEVLSRAAGLVYPSMYEGFGMPVIEGMAAGIPVISGTGGSLVEVGGDAVIYVRPLNEQQLAAAMIAATGEDARLRARTAGRERLAELVRRQQGTRLADVVAATLGDDR